MLQGGIIAGSLYILTCRIYLIREYWYRSIIIIYGALLSHFI
jgi:hypothetical protein